MAYLVHHTLNGNSIYTDGKRNTLPIEEKKLNEKSQHKKSSQYKHQLFFSIVNQWKKVSFEWPIHWIINSVKMEGANFGSVPSIC